MKVRQIFYSFKKHIFADPLANFYKVRTMFQTDTSLVKISMLALFIFVLGVALAGLVAALQVHTQTEMAELSVEDTSQPNSNGKGQNETAEDTLKDGNSKNNTGQNNKKTSDDSTKVNQNSNAANTASIGSQNDSSPSSIARQNVSGAKPNATNTGVPSGVSLTSSGSITVTTNGAVIDARHITGSITVKANNVTIKRSKISSSSYYPIRLYSGYSGLLVEDVEIAGNGCSAGIVFGGYTARRVHVYGCADGLKAGNNTTIENSYIHDLYKTSTSHNDGIQSPGGSNIVIRNNNIAHRKQQTSAILLQTDNAPIDNVLIEGNWLDGGNFVVYSRNHKGGGDPTNVRIINNRFGRNYVYGLFSIDGMVKKSGNVWDDTGEPI